MNGTSGLVKFVLAILFALAASSFAYTERQVDSLEEKILHRLDRIEDKIDDIIKDRARVHNRSR